MAKMGHSVEQIIDKLREAELQRAVELELQRAG